MVAEGQAAVFGSAGFHCSWPLGFYSGSAAAELACLGERGRSAGR